MFCSVSLHLKVHHLKEIHSIYLCIAVVQIRDDLYSYPTEQQFTGTSHFYSCNIITKVSLACLMVSGDTPTFSFPTSASFWYCVLGGWGWKLRSREGHQRGCLVGVFLAPGRVLPAFKVTGENIFKMQKFPDSISNTLLKRDGEVLDWVDWSRVD